MKDIGHEETEKVLKEIEKRISEEYARAEKEVSEKLNDYLEKFRVKDALKQKAVDNGMITEEEYKQWRVGQIMMGQRWTEMRDTLAEDFTNADKIARSIAYDHMPEVYALNYDYGTFQVEKGSQMDTSYTLYDRNAFEKLVKNEDTFIPAPGRKVSRDIKEGKALAWNKKEVQSAMMQGLLQGESIPKLATRVADTVGESDRKAAIRNARTMTTGVQNAGRVASYDRANDMGIVTRKQWLATLDNRTRHWHAFLDGEVVDNDQPFENEYGEIMYPGDPSADPANIFNCRCTLIASIKGFERDVSDLNLRHDDHLEDMSYEEWREGHYKQQSDSITKQDDIANAMQQSYNNEYRKIRNSMLEEDADEGLLSDAVNKIKNAVNGTNNDSDAEKILSSYSKIDGEHSYLDDLKNTNPNYEESRKLHDGKYTENCQRSINAYEARRRGYDVVAKPKLGDDELSNMNSKNGWANVYKNGKKSIIHIPTDTNYGARRNIISRMQEWGDGSRAIVRVKIKNAGGHVFITENHNGKVVFIDPQKNINDCYDYFDYIVPKKTYLLRIDDKEFTSLIGQCCEPRK